ncbi:GL14813 [Drosophila persimilis]|uniref:GL14813 n=1 Tax=Drosophila persimilis TaxID=7234 RepID=B4H0P0_DROPE|nr:GL14813 [Drosophila persimilis]
MLDDIIAGLLFADSQRIRKWTAALGNAFDNPQALPVLYQILMSPRETQFIHEKIQKERPKFQRVMHHRHYEIGLDYSTPAVVLLQFFRVSLSRSTGWVVSRFPAMASHILYGLCLFINNYTGEIQNRTENL